MELSELRKQINEADIEILNAFRKRMEISRNIAEVKCQRHLPLVNLLRENEHMEELKMLSGDLGNYTERLFKLLMDLSKEEQMKIFDANGLDESGKGKALL